MSPKPSNITVIIDEDDIDCPPLPPRDALPVTNVKPVQNHQLSNEYPPMETNFTTTGYQRDQSIPPPLPPRKVSAGDILLTHRSGKLQ